MKHAEMLKLMGRMVLVTKVLERQKERKTQDAKVVSGWWEEKPLEKPRTGWVVGFRHLQVGYVEPESGGYASPFGDDSHEPAEWRTEGVIPCLMVAFWPTVRPVHVPMDGFLKVSRGSHIYIDPVIHKMCHAPEPHRTTWKDRIKDTEYVEETEARFREFMKNEMKDWPRDDNGRWKKKEK